MGKIKNKLFRYMRGITPLDKLIADGLTVGKNFDYHYGTIIDDSCPWLITFGDNVELAPRCHVLAHDTSTNLITGKTRLGFVTIGNNVFVGADTIILPNVKIGDNVVIGAGSVVSRDIPSNSIAAGNPAKVIGDYNEYANRKKAELKSHSVFDDKFTLRNTNLTNDMKQEMIKKMKDNGGIGYVD